METAIISGKGGTGKSSITAAFASLLKNCILADCDVDATNMHILFEPEISRKTPFMGSLTARVHPELCTLCNRCISYCRFDAITKVNGHIEISEVACDGCSLCARICPSDAISMLENKESAIYEGSYRFGEMVFGMLAPGEENSGKLVSLVREKANQIATDKNIPHIILDGPPGIGCPVISTISGVDKIIIVTEPTLSGLHDLKRTLEVTSQYKSETMVIINKFDINLEVAEEIQQYCTALNISIIGKIPFDSSIVEAMVKGKSIIEHFPASPISNNISNIFKKAFKL
jgi:MinD superfamily P-loop ATPase